MNHGWNAFLECLWPSRCGPPAGQNRRRVLLQALIALTITLAWGPEFFAAMEMTALLEMLGASLFLTAYAAGFKLKAIELFRALHRFILPPAQVAVMRSSAPASMKALAALFVVANATWCLGAVMVVGAYGQHLLTLAT